MCFTRLQDVALANFLSTGNMRQLPGGAFATRLADMSDHPPPQLSVSAARPQADAARRGASPVEGERGDAETSGAASYDIGLSDSGLSEAGALQAALADAGLSETTRPEVAQPETAPSHTATDHAPPPELPSSDAPSSHPTPPESPAPEPPLAEPPPPQPGRFDRAREAQAQALAEDYTELIDDLIAATGEARITEIAAHLGVTHPTATKSVARLVREGLAVSRPYRGVFLTETGRTMAARVRARHRCVVDVLIALGVPPEAAETDAEGIEHHVSDATLAAFERFLGARSG